MKIMEWPFAMISLCDSKNIHTHSYRKSSEILMGRGPQKCLEREGAHTKKSPFLFHKHCTVMI